MIWQAIVTKWFKPTNTKGSRIKATAQAGFVFVPYNHSLSNEKNHEVAAMALCEIFGWRGELVCGAMPDGGGYAFVFSSKD